MMLLWCLLYLVVVMLVGAALTSSVLRDQRRPIPELLGLASLLGAGTCGTILLWFSMLGLKPTRTILLALGTTAVVSLLAMFRHGALPHPVVPRWDRRWSSVLLGAPLVLALLAANLWVVIPALGFELFEWDSFSIWGFKAKVLYHSALTPRPAYFQDVRLTFSHLDYPLLAPMLTAGSYAMMGQVDDRLGKIILPLILAGQTVLAYSAARLWLGRLAALMAAILLVCAPMNLEFAGLGVADVTLATFWLGSILYLVRWIDSRLTSDAILTALFAVFTALTKSEGLPLAVMVVVITWVIACRGRVWKHALWLSAIVAVGTGIWLIWRSGVPHTDENYLAQLRWSIISENAHRLKTILPALGGAFIDVRRWGGLWILVALMAVLGYRAFARSRTLVLWAVFLAHLSVYGIVYVISPWEDLRALLSASLVRILLHVAPAAMMLVAAHWAAVGRRDLFPQDSAGEPPEDERSTRLGYDG